MSSAPSRPGLVVRLARGTDAESVAEIYNQGITERNATFETTLRTAADLRQRIEAAPAGFATIVAEDAGAVVGWASIASYRERPCYAGVGEFSVYIHRDARGRGVGRALLSRLVEEARTRGYWKLLSRVFPANTASLGLCRSLGFREVGTYEKHGQLDGRWLDVVIVERLIPENQPDDPGDPVEGADPLRATRGAALSGAPRQLGGPGMPNESELNKDALRRLLAEVDRGNLDVVDTYYAPGYVDHTPSPGRSLAPGRDGVREALAVFHRAFPDTRHTIEDLFAEGDRVVARISARATHTGDLFGHAGTGRVVTLTSIAIYRFVDGQIAERWAEHSQGVLDQLGISTPGRAPHGIPSQ